MLLYISGNLFPDNFFLCIMPTESPMSSRPRTTRGINAIRSRPGPTSRQGDVDSLGGSFSGGDPAPESVLPAIVR